MINGAQYVWEPAASASNNGDFILIETYSGYRDSAFDPQGKQVFLQLNADDITLGQAVLEALGASRGISPEEIKIFYNPQWREDIYKQWVASLMERFGYKTKQALFRKMNSCSLEMKGDLLIISPSHHVKLEAWDGPWNGEKDNVVIPKESTPAEIGAALRLAFSRCTSKF